ncbi:MAG: hypothetical protein JKY75_12010 [Erythrobacter sp.]|nr:hypothetical protein [Erythrobacter sp.]
MRNERSERGFDVPFDARLGRPLSGRKADGRIACVSGESVAIGIAAAAP